MSDLCEDCPPIDYPTNKTRCRSCPRRYSLDRIRALYDNAEKKEPNPGTSAHIVWMAEMEMLTALIQAVEESRGAVIQ